MRARRSGLLAALLFGPCVALAGAPDDFLRLLRVAEHQPQLSATAWSAALQALPQRSPELAYEVARVAARALPRPRAHALLRAQGVLCLSALQLVSGDRVIPWSFGATFGRVAVPEGVTELRCPIRLGKAQTLRVLARGGGAWEASAPAGDAWLQVPVVGGATVELRVVARDGKPVAADTEGRPGQGAAVALRTLDAPPRGLLDALRDLPPSPGRVRALAAFDQEVPPDYPPLESLDALLDEAALGPQERTYAALTAAHALAPDRADLQLELVRLEGERGQVLAALAQLDALALPPSPQQGLTRASLLASAGALADAQRLAEALPRDLPATLELLASVLQRRGLPEAALACWLERDALSPSEDALAAAFELAKSLGRRDEARRLVQALVAARPDNPGYRLEAARLERLVGDAPAARAVLDAALADFPFDADLYALSGQLHAAEGRPAEAREAFAASLRLRPHQPDLRADLAALEGERAAFAAPWRVSPEEVALTEATTDASDGARNGTIVANRRVTRLHAGGASDAWTQLLFRVGPGAGGNNGTRVFSFDYDPSQRSQDVLEATVYRAGEPVADADLEDVSLSDGSSLYVDMRSTRLSFGDLATGDLIAIELLASDFAKNELLGVFSEVAGFGWAEPAEDAVAVWLAPDGVALHSAVAAPAGVLTERRRSWRAGAEQGGTLLEVEAHALAPIATEGDMPGYTEVAPYVHVSTLADWPAVGRWFVELAGDGLEPTTASTALARSLVPAGASLADALPPLFDYVARNVRYVGLEFGVHGYKPYGVAATLARGYGDCKDKAVLLRALLAGLGFRADLTLVRTRGKGNMADAVASPSVFDHAILYVPELDRFVDATANWAGALELPGADQGATALVLAPEGARAVVIPPRPAAENRLEMTLDVQPLPEGGYAVRGVLDAAGTRAMTLRQSLATEATRRDVLRDQLASELPGASLESFSAQLGFGGPIQIQFSARLPAGPIPLLPTGWSMRRRLAAQRERTHDVVAEPFTWRRRVTLPEGLVSLPPDEVVPAPFGEAVRRVRPEGERVTLELGVVFARDRVEAKDYAGLRRFADDADRLFEPAARLTPTPRAGGPAPR